MHGMKEKIQQKPQSGLSDHCLSWSEVKATFSPGQEILDFKPYPPQSLFLDVRR
jgi:hypothetical protein